MEGMKLWFSPKLFISERALQENDLALALVIFAEYQHTGDGGGMNEYDAMQELIQIRRMLPDWLRTKYINELVHKGQTNEY